MSPEADVPTVLFVCGHNAGRSQMAEAWVRHLSGGRVRAVSAGTAPGERINPLAVQAMDEVGVSVAGQCPKVVTADMVQQADRTITMGCGVDVAACPASFLVTDDWGLDDPHGQGIEAVRRIRDEIRTRVEALIAELGAA